MKAHTKMASQLSTILLIAGTVFKIQHWPYAAQIIVLGTACFVFWALPSVWISLKKATFNNTATLVLSALSFFIFTEAIGILFKIMHWPGGSVLIVLGAFIYALIFSPLYLYYGLKSISSSKTKLFFSLLVMGFAILMTGNTFKIQLWPNANFLLLSGFLLVLTGLYLYNKSEELSALNLFKQKTNLKFFYLNILAYLFLIINLSGSSTVMAEADLIKRNIESDIKIFHENSISDVKSLNSKNHDALLKVHKLSDDVIQYIDNMATNLVFEVSGGRYKSLDSLNIEDIRKADNFDIPVSVLIGSEPDHPKTGAYTALELKNKLKAYKMNLLSFADLNHRAALKTKIGLELDDKVENGLDVKWEIYNFYHVPLRTDLITLTQLKFKVRIAEGELIDYLNLK